MAGRCARHRRSRIVDRTLSLPDLVRLFAPAQPLDPVGDGDGTAGDAFHIGPARFASAECWSGRSARCARRITRPTWRRGPRPPRREPQAQRSKPLRGSNGPSDRLAQTDLVSMRQSGLALCGKLSASIRCSVTALTLFAIDFHQGLLTARFSSSVRFGAWAAAAISVGGVSAMRRYADHPGRRARRRGCADTRPIKPRPSKEGMHWPGTEPLRDITFSRLHAAVDDHLEEHRLARR